MGGWDLVRGLLTMPTLDIRQPDKSQRAPREGRSDGCVVGHRPLDEQRATSRPHP